MLGADVTGVSAGYWRESGGRRAISAVPTGLPVVAWPPPMSPHSRASARRRVGAEPFGVPSGNARRNQVQADGIRANATLWPATACVRMRVRGTKGAALGVII